MQQVADWLKKLGMSEYSQRFAENDIDASVLPHLTDENLKELGISLGHRVKLLALPPTLAGALVRWGVRKMADPIGSPRICEQGRRPDGRVRAGGTKKSL